MLCLFQILRRVEPAEVRCLTLRLRVIIGLLAANPLPVGIATMEIAPRPLQVRQVRDQRGDIAGLLQRFGERDVFIVEMMPAWGRPGPAWADALSASFSCLSKLADQALWASLNFACGARSTHRWEIESVARHIDSSAAERHAFRFETGALFEPCVSREAYVPARPHYAVPGNGIFGIVEGPCDLSGCAWKARRARDIAVSRDLALGNSPYCLAEPLQHILLCYRRTMSGSMLVASAFARSAPSGSPCCPNMMLKLKYSFAESGST